MRESFFISLLIRQFNPKLGAELLQTMPKELQEQIKKEISPISQVKPFLIRPAAWIASFHPSWLQEIINSYPSTWRKKLTKPSTGSEFSLFHKFLLVDLVKRSYPKDFIPESLLQNTARTPLLSLSRQDKTALIDLLGLYDINPELKKIVEKPLLNEIHKALSPLQMGYLRKILFGKNNVKSLHFPLKLGMNLDELKKNIHLRGLVRLSKAISSEEPMFRWHFVKGLDLSRGKAILDVSKDVQPPKILSYLHAELLSAMNYLKENLP